MEISIVVPTLGRAALLARVLDRIENQSATPESYEVIVVADAQEEELAAVDRVLQGRGGRCLRLQAERPGASAARNAGWRAAGAPLVLFLDDDVLPGPSLLTEHLAWHADHAEPQVGVLGHVRWADEIRVTPFLRWLEHGVQFNFPAIQGTEADWGFFYTANVSVKRSLLDEVGGFEEEQLPFGYEDLDFAYRARKKGFRLLYNRAAEAEHLHRMDIEFWKRRVRRIAVAESQFIRLHPDFRPYFHEFFSSAAQARPARGRGERLARFIPRELPVLGPWVWRSADAVYRQALAGPFLEAWEEAQALQLEAREASSGGSSPGGPK